MFVDRVLAGFRRQRVPGSHPPRFHQLTPFQERCNAIIGHYRSRVEQVISVCKNHAAMSKGGVAFRGDVRFLEAIINVTMHTTAVLIAMEPTRRSPCYPDPTLDPDGWAH